MRPACRILLDADIVPTEPRPHRPFQGWRYLKPEEAPVDMLSPGQGAEIPAALREELRDLGLL